MTMGLILVLCLVGAEAPKQPSPVLELSPPGKDVLLGQILEKAASGDLHAAVEEVKLLDSADETPTTRGDIDALVDLAQLSDDLLTLYKGNGKYIAVLGEKKSVGKVVEFDPKKLLLRTSSGRKIELSRSAFDLAQVVKLIRKRKIKLGNPVLLGTAMLLAGENLKASMKVAGAKSRVIKDRAKRWEKLRDEASLRAQLVQLASCSKNVPSDPTDALADLDSVFSGSKGHPDVEANRNALIALGGRLLSVQFDRTGQFSRSYKGKGKALPDGRVEFSYDFSSPDQLDDFVDESFPISALAQHQGEFKKVRAAQDGKKKSGSRSSINDGVLLLGEGASLFHRATLMGDVDLEIVASLDLKKNAGKAREFVMILCDDGAGSMGSCDLRGGIWVENVAAEKRQIESSLRPLKLKKEYGLRFERRNNTFAVLIDEVEVVRKPDEGVSKGRTGFVVLGGLTVSVSKLVLRGRFDTEAVLEVRNAWVEQNSSRWR